MTERAIELMDTTLRDGEQTPDLSYTPSEKFQVARLLLREVRVDRVEIASARVSSGEAEAVRRIASWARRTGQLGSVEILGFADGKASVDWIADCGAQVINLLTKGSRAHCEKQLRMTPERHFKQVADTIRYARSRGMGVNVYLEDWSHGVRDSFDYVFAHVQNLAALRVDRVLLPDTLGVLTPEDVGRYLELMVRTWPGLHFDFHAQNDYGLATANSLAAARAGARGIHTTVNGLGERAGNAHLAEVVAGLRDLTPYRSRVDEGRLASISEMVAAFSGKAVAGNLPIVGRDVFTHTAGIHSDGESKGRLYSTRLAPRRFGRRPRYALGKLAGKASLDQNLKALGIELSPENRAMVLQRVIELGDKKHAVTATDLPFIIADALKAPRDQRVQIERYAVTSGTNDLPSAEVDLAYHRQRAQARSTGDGSYDAFMKAVTKAARRLDLSLPRLIDYRVRISPGGKTGALVETVITWRFGTRGDPFSTQGVDSDQIAAAVVATETMLNVVARRPRRRRPPRT
ncbi:MAG: alpha-isopropylmalate synthase regulatory domain-containing protein [Myxococcota bacterium]